MDAAMNERPIPTGEGLTFEKVWAMLQETSRESARETERIRKLQEETDRIVKENAEQIKETDRQMRETDRQIKETDRQIQETSREVKETGRQIKSLNKQMGGLHNSFGEMTEHLVAPGIIRRFNELGFKFRRACRQVIFDEKGTEIAEVDLMMENGNYVIATEVKSKPKDKHIEHHIKQMKILREEMVRHNDNRKIYGALAGAIFGAREKAMAIDAGFFVLEQSGDTMKISIPEGFTPKEW